MPVGVQQGRAVLPIKPMIYWELPAGIDIELPAEIEAFLIGEGMAEPVRFKGENNTGGR